MPRHYLTAAILVAALVGGCGGDDSAEPSTTTVPAPTTTSEATTTTTTAPVPTTTTTTEPPPPTDEELAEMIMLESGFFGPDWDELAQTESDFTYEVIEGCEFVEVLAEADGFAFEAESPEFSQLDTEIEHDVRIYPDAENATDVVLAWAEDATLNCVLEAARLQAQEGLDRGELAPYTSVDFDLTRFDNVVGEPRVTNIEMKSTFSSPDDELVLFIDVYTIQVGRSVSRIVIRNPDAVWDQTDQLLDVVVDRMLAADAADTS
ncbi:MAG: hypothetical protein OEP52_03045 [Acidimicrobiia bacterium]|nr:hypothetical protein [Acidimicrobiia bacterium]